MYIKKLEYLQQRFKQNNLRSGITTKYVKSIPIGSPCIIDLNVSNHKKHFLDKGEDSEISLDMKRPLKDESTQATVLFLFNNNNDYVDIVISNNRLSKICYTDDKPLIYDSYNSILLDSSKENVISNGIFDQIKNQLNNSRFVNYMFEGVKSSNVNNVILNIDKIVTELLMNYKNTTSFYYYPYTDSRVLVDVVSISFYKIRDVIPIFNYRKSEGICMEIMMTNSDVKDNQFVKEGYSMTYRFIFAKYSENIFSIDGEPVKRINDIGVKESIASSYSLLKRSTPKDVSKDMPVTVTEKKHKKVKKASFEEL